MPNNGTLLIARHHESEWNRKGEWTGNRNIHLTDHGHIMSREMGLQIKEFHIDQAVCSTQHRSHETLLDMLSAMGQEGVPILRSGAINERDYGDYTGKNKLAMKELIGEVEYNRLHREWDYPIPHGESLKMVYERSVPFYRETVLPMLLEGKNVLMVSHGNTIRSLMKYIESISDEQIKDVEMLFGTIVIYDVDQEGKMVDKNIRFTEPYESHH